MAKRNRLASQAAAKIVETAQPKLVWEALPSTPEVVENKPSPFGGKAVSGKKSVPVALVMWAAGQGINPDIFQDDLLNFCIKDKIPYNAWNQFVSLLHKYREDKKRKVFNKQLEKNHPDVLALKDEFVEIVKNG